MRHGSVFSFLVLAATGLHPSCHSAEANAVGATVLLGVMPGHELEQVYYLGVFDPFEQVPPTIYRVTVHGQASALAETRFASGWVPAAAIDSLGTTLTLSDGEGAAVGVLRGELGELTLETGRHLTAFGPEGFRTHPRDHRLVIVMGADPDEFFQGVDSAIATVTDVRVAALAAEERERITALMLDAHREQERLLDLIEALDAELER